MTEAQRGDAPRPYDHFIDRLVKACDDELPLFSAGWWQRSQTPVEEHFVLAVLDEAALHAATAVVVTIGARVLIRSDGRWGELPQKPPRQFIQDWFVWAADPANREAAEAAAAELTEMSLRWSPGRLYIGGAMDDWVALASHVTGLSVPGAAESDGLNLRLGADGRWVGLSGPDYPAQVLCSLGNESETEDVVLGTLTEVIELATAYLGGETLSEIAFEPHDPNMDELQRAFRSLRHPNPWVRQEAAILLRLPAELLDGAPSFEIACELITVLPDIDPDVRYQAALSLGALGYDEAVEPLTAQARRDPNPHVREACKSAVARIRRRWGATEA